MVHIDKFPFFGVSSYFEGPKKESSRQGEQRCKPKCQINEANLVKNIFKNTLQNT
jgi:hypothetical protein